MIALIALLQTISPPLPVITPRVPEMVFTCSRAGKAGVPLVIALPTGLNGSEVLVSDPGRVLGGYTFTRYRWKIGTDGGVSLTFSSNGDSRSPVLTVEQVVPGSKDYRGRAHPFYRPKKLTFYSCQLMQGDGADAIIKQIRAERG